MVSVGLEPFHLKILDTLAQASRFKKDHILKSDERFSKKFIMICPGLGLDLLVIHITMTWSRL